MPKNRPRHSHLPVWRLQLPCYARGWSISVLPTKELGRLVVAFCAVEDWAQPLGTIGAKPPCGDKCEHSSKCNLYRIHFEKNTMSHSSQLTAHSSSKWVKTPVQHLHNKNQPYDRYLHTNHTKHQHDVSPDTTLPQPRSINHTLQAIAPSVSHFTDALCFIPRRMPNSRVSGLCRGRCCVVHRWVRVKTLAMARAHDVIRCVERACRDSANNLDLGSRAEPTRMLSQGRTYTYAVKGQNLHTCCQRAKPTHMLSKGRTYTHAGPTHMLSQSRTCARTVSRYTKHRADLHSCCRAIQSRGGVRCGAKQRQQGNAQ